MLNVDQWCEVLRQYPTAKERALQILKGINGYGTEYGYYFDEDSENLLNALKAFWILQEHEKLHERAKEPYLKGDRVMEITRNALIGVTRTEQIHAALDKALDDMLKELKAKK